jgi:hypothetical protein
MITTKISIILAVLLAVTALSTIGIGVARAENAIDRALKNGESITFDMNTKTGVTASHDKHGNTVVTDRYGNTLSESNSASASASRADSTSSANSQNNVNCFMFCLGISTANSGSAANSDSRTNSPGTTATAMPVSPKTTTNAQPETTVVQPQPQQGGLLDEILHGKQHRSAPTGFQQPDTMEGLRKLVPASTQCIDNTGSHQDTGYDQGYADGQRDFRQQLGFDNSLHQHHTDEFKTGYHDGYQAGFDDARSNVFKNPC